MTLVRLNFSTTPVKRRCGSHLGPQLLNTLLAFLLSSCAGSSNPQLISPSEGPTSARYLEIYSELHAATLHFPADVYTLNAVDKIGYYYRAPRKVAERIGSGSLWREGGIFVSKRDPQKLRGYVYRAGTITHVGNFSGVKHTFRDQPLASTTSDF
jgi:hypothetical protein